MGIFDPEHWAKFGKGYSVYDCAFGFGNRYAFLMYEKNDTPHRDPLPRIAFVFARMERPMETRFYRVTFGNFDFARIAYGEGFETEFVSVDFGGLTYSYNPPRSIEEPEHPWRIDGSDLAAVVTQVVRIGQNIYTVGGPRRMHRRDGVGQWTDMTSNLALPKDVEKPGKGLSYLWQDAAGFSEQDIYVAGGDGDVWRFDGKKFSQCSFPSNELLFNVCCASDGNVYVGGNMGSLYVGRENKWKKLSDGSFSVPWKVSGNSRAPLLA